MTVLPFEGTYPVLYGTLAVPVGSHYRRGYLARPDRSGRFPTALVVPDIGGLTSHEKSLCRRLARQGVAALAVELFEETPGDVDAGVAAYAALTDPEALRVLDETHEYLDSDDLGWCHSSRLGVLGLDVGGRFALIAATSRPWVGAVTVVSTPLTGDEDRRFQVADLLASIPVPLLGLYGGDDPLIAAATVDEAQRRNPSGTWLLYAGARHFFTDEDSDDYDEAAANDAGIRISEFFRTHLPPADVEDLG